MQAKDITDRDTLERWLKSRPQPDSTLIATRAALRVAPLCFSTMQQDWAVKARLTSLPILRTTLITSVACNAPSEYIGTAAFAAARSARSAGFGNNSTEVSAGNFVLPAALFAANSARFAGLSAAAPSGGSAAQSAARSAQYAARSAA